MESNPKVSAIPVLESVTVIGSNPHLHFDGKFYGDISAFCNTGEFIKGSGVPASIISKIT